MQSKSTYVRIYVSFQVRSLHGFCYHIYMNSASIFTLILLPYLYGFCFHAGGVKSREQDTWDNEPVYEPMDDGPIHEMTGLRTKAELRGGELCSTPQLFQSLLRS